MANKRATRRSSQKARRALWALAVFRRAVFPGLRLKARAATILDARLRRPGDSIAQGSGSTAAVKTAEWIQIHLALCSATAARLLQITHWARAEPKASCTEPCPGPLVPPIAHGPRTCGQR